MLSLTALGDDASLGAAEMCIRDRTRPNFETFERFYGIRYIIPENATFATAYGAALHALEK